MADGKTEISVPDAVLLYQVSMVCGTREHGDYIA